MDLSLRQLSFLPQPHHLKKKKKKKTSTKLPFLPQTPTGFISTLPLSTYHVSHSLATPPHTTLPAPHSHDDFQPNTPYPPPPPCPSPLLLFQNHLSPPTLPASPLKADCPLPTPPSVLSPAASMTSLATKTTTLKMSASSTLVPSLAMTIDDGAYPPGSTELDEETGHNCKMS